jgi:alanyl-tRNA synthetase
MQTQLLYLDDSYLKTMEAKIVDVKEESAGKWRIILDKTVFYPMGGGQSTDQGVLKSENWEGQVYQVMMKDGEVWHYVTSSQQPEVGTTVTGEINWERRFKHMRLHSAGHVVDFAIFMLGFSPEKLMPFKGDHGKKPFIVYQGTVDENIQQKIEDKANEIVEKNLQFSWQFQSVEDLQKEAIYLQPGLPTNKPLRTLRLEGVGAVADGGTQVRNTQEVGKITIPNIEVKEGNTVVHYSIE